MKREAGFTLLEMMVSIGITVGVVTLAVGALLQAQSASQIVGYQANTQENLRAAMHFIVRDLTQAGEGIPQGGLSVPSNGVTSTINRPGTATTFQFNGSGMLTLPPVVAGSGIGQFATTVNPATSAIVTGNQTDIINIMYADNVLIDTHSPTAYNTYTYPVTQLLNPTCAGIISPSGAFVTMDTNCFTMPGKTNPITTGNLIMFHNQNGTALEYVTSVAGQTINFAGGDPAGLNQTGKTVGTVYALQNFVAGVPTGFPATSITRVWMVTYYLDFATNPSKPQLIRQVNYPNYPAGAGAANPPQQVADIIEYLTFSYDITGSLAAAGTYPLGAGNAPAPVAPDTNQQIRAVNIFLAGRSEYAYKAGTSQAAFMRNNLVTQVCPRSLSFTNLFQTSTSQTSN